MKSFDVIFIHPPRVLNPDHKKRAKTVRSVYLFIPMGIFAIADTLEREGFGVKIVNYPLERYLNPNWSLKDYLRTIDFKICGIDLHWIHNAHGAIEIARIVKEEKPNVKVILGGFSASYFHTQILKYYRSIDGIIRGEGEIPLLKYVQNINQNHPLDSVPNFSYRNSSNHIKTNPLSYTAKTLDNLNFTNVSLLKNAKHYFEDCSKVMGISVNLPIGRGCPFNCPFCGGGQRALQNLSGRDKVILRSPEKVIDDITFIKDTYKVQSLFFGHGAYPANLKYWKTLFGLIQKEKLDIGADLEIWRLPFPKEMWKIFSKTFSRRYSSVGISPRTLSSKVHQKIAKICDPTFKFPENQIEDLIKNANLFRRTLRIWLTVGFPFQTRLDVQKDFNFGVKCMLKYGRTILKPITIMSEPYHIFPGSPAFESPKIFDINLKYNSFPQLERFFKQAKMSFFYNAINYDTKILSQTSIRTLNMLLFLSTALTLMTTGSKFS
ncbi:MAG: cobalamin-dependent protein [Candidatus Lokiarchaeota archaeon]|nr:cobalamin-dependent protein [Candidatus Lokiarchaeota archaeon]